MYPKLSVFLLICASFWILVVTATPRSKPSKALMKKKFIPKKTNCTLNEFCAPPTYPVKAIKSLLKRNKKKFEYLSGTVIEPLNASFVSYRSPEEGENMCKTRKYTVVPKAVFDTKKRLKYIVNVDDFKQIITYETCVDKEQNCSGNEYWPNDFQTFCKQVYTILRLLSVSHTGKMEYAYFPVPSNCICAYRKLNSYNDF